MIDAYLDAELGRDSSKQVESHISECPSCQQFAETRSQLSRIIKDAVPYAAAPIGLGVKLRRDKKSPFRRFGPIAVGLAFAVCAASTFLVLRPRLTPSEQLVNDLVSDHYRSRLRGHEVDIDSSKITNIEPWFKAKGLDYCPPILDFGSKGFKLVGGRVDSSQGRKLVTLVYSHNDRIIDLSVTPLGYADPINADRNETHIRVWNNCGLGYWAMADGDPEALIDLESMFPNRER